jgi:putative transposase
VGHFLFADASSFIRQVWLPTLVGGLLLLPLLALPRRWVVERTLGWLNLPRRLSKDYERLTPTSEPGFIWRLSA